MSAIRSSWQKVVGFLRSLAASVPRTSRSLRRAPGFVAIAALSLGVALGLSTSVFALIDAMTHPNSPYDHVEQLFEVHVFGSSRIRPSSRDLREGLLGINGIERVASAGIGRGEIEAGETMGFGTIAHTPPGFFEMLGVHARIGRMASADEARQERVALASDDFWKERFQNRREIGNARATIDGHVYTIVGVLPPRANAPIYISLWIPQAADTSGGFGVPVVRLRRGVTPEDVQPQLNAIMKRLTKVYGSANDRPYAASLSTLRPDPLALKDFHRAMIGAAICVLLIACANVAALMLARGTVRRRDYALRLAIGASRADIAREVLFEVAALAAIGSVAGAIVATWAVGAMSRATPLEMRWMGFTEPQWSARVLGMSALAVLVAVAVAGGIPAWTASRTDPAGTLKESSGGNTGRAGTRFRWLVMAELALSMTLMVGASLMLKSAVLMASVDFGLDVKNLLGVTTWVNRYDKHPASEVMALYRESLTRIQAIPGVESAAMTAGCAFRHPIVTTDRTIEGGRAATNPTCANVTSDYFRTFGRRIVEGRDFADGDVRGDGAVILDQKTARKLFPHESPLGRMLKLGDLASRQPWLTVVGVVRDPENEFNPFPELGSDSSEAIFISAPDSSRDTHKFVVRRSREATGVKVALTRALVDLMPPQSFVRVAPWNEKFDNILDEQRFLASVFAMLGAASLLLGAAGLFSVVSYIAGQRMREFAVRIALGATRENVAGLVLREALVMALGGTGVGAGLGMWAGFLLWDKMYQVYPVDVESLVAAEITLVLATMLACLLPALRAMRADPVQVMRAT